MSSAFTSILASRHVTSRHVLVLLVRHKSVPTTSRSGMGDTRTCVGVRACVCVRARERSVPNSCRHSFIG